MSSSGGKRIPALGGYNPDYYAETASIAPGGSGSGSGSNSQRPPSNSQTSSHPPPKPPRPGRPQQHQHQQQPSYSAPQPNPLPYQQPPPPQSYYQQQSTDIPPPKPPRPAVSSSAAHPPSNNNGTSTSPSPSSSSKTKTLGERLHQWTVKAGAPINKVTNMLGSEAFWPDTMDQECNKAARILKSFCTDSFPHTGPDRPSSSSALNRPGTPNPSPGPKGKPTRSLITIPPSAIQTCAGLAIFTTFRTGLHISGASGSGIVVSRLPSGQGWSPPSGFVVHTLGAGLMIGVDIYDCVCVLRTPEAVRAFTRPRVSLGGEIGLVAGPVGAGGAVEAAVDLLGNKKGNNNNDGNGPEPVWSYIKSRGLYAGVQADGTVIVARPDANAEFYGRRGITVEQILAGDVPRRGPEGMWPEGARQLMEVLKAAEGRRDVDERVIREVSRGGPSFGDIDTKGMEAGVVDTEMERPRSYDGRGRYH